MLNAFVYPIESFLDVLFVYVWYLVVYLPHSLASRYLDGILCIGQIPRPIVKSSSTALEV